VMALEAVSRALGWSPAYDLAKGLDDFKATRDVVG